MVQLDTILEAFVTACEQSTMLPSQVTYSTIVLDRQGSHSNVNPPVIEFSIDEIERNRSRNTERVGVENDSNGDEIGYIYTQWFDAIVEAEVLSVAGTEYNHRELQRALGDVLYQYDSQGMNHQLPDPNAPSDPLPDVSWISLLTTTPNSDFALSPSVRTRTMTIEVGFTHEIRESDYGITYETVEDVDLSTEVVMPDN